MQTLIKIAIAIAMTGAKAARCLPALLAVGFGTSMVRAADGGGETELAKKVQNPVSDLISVPFESNFNFHAGTEDATVYDLLVQPIIPFHLTKDWNLITRTIIPIINEPSLFPGRGSAFGLGDINPSFFLSPAKPSVFMWGIGPTFTLPTATDALLSSQKFSMGPAAAALIIKGPWLVGLLVNNQWSVTGWGNKGSVNQMLIEPFVNYNFGKGWHLSSELVMTANWEAESGDCWTVPVGGGLGKVTWFGKLPVDVTLEAYDNVEHPKYAADWQLRFRVTFLLPTFKYSEVPSRHDLK